MGGCPSCGSDSLVRGERQDALGGWVEFVECQNCGTVLSESDPDE